MKSGYPRLVALLLCLLLTSLAACGRKGPVQPLIPRISMAPAVFSATQVGQRMLLSWDLPTQNQDGSPMTNLQGFHLYKMSYDPANECAECRDTSILVKSIDMDFLQETRRQGNRLYFWDESLEIGLGYRYRVVAFNREGRNGNAGQVRTPFLIPPSAPAGLTAESHDRMVRLAWQPAKELREGIELLGYNVYKHPLGETLVPQPINSRLLTETTFDDFDVKNDRGYVYTVTTSSRIRGILVESAFSARSEVTPKAGN